jgi:hypothetical protein
MVFLTSTQVNAQSATAIIKSNTHLGGYHIKCNGQSTGVLEAEPNFGTAPYSFQWNTGETTPIITDKPAGVYFVTVVDANNIMQTDTFELKQPRPFSYEAKTSDFDGFQISANNKQDGMIEIIANGGTPPYQFQWNNGDSISLRKDLSAGQYEFIITDANFCTSGGNVLLTEPAPIMVNISNVQGASCFGGNDGKASINITGGRGDFSVVWSNGNFSFTPQDLKAGHNLVRIFEHGKAVLDTGITITEPAIIETNFTLSQYNNYNVSCADCYNGSINTIVNGGTAPYTYQWNDDNNSTTPNLSNLNGGEYRLIVSDANGCKLENSIRLSMPAAKDWGRFGNANIDTAQFIGSTDSSPIVFKVNNEEVVEMKKDTINFNARVRLRNLESATAFQNTNKLIGIDEDGNIKAYTRFDVIEAELNPVSSYSCDGCGCSPKLSWGAPLAMVDGVQTQMNTMDIVKCPSEGNVGIGRSIPEANSKLDIFGEIAISGSRLNVGYNGNVGVGTDSPNEKLHLFGGNFKVTCPWDNLNPVFFVDNASKNVGVGTAQPRGKFEIKVNEIDIVTFGNMRTEASGWATSYIGFNAYRQDGGLWKTTGDASNSGGAVIYANAAGDLMFSTINGENAPYEVLTADHGINYNTKMFLTNNGVLGIGVNPKNHWDLLNYKLVVDGQVKCKKLRVDLQNWGDYVFDSSYNLMDLKNLEKYITENKHLPGMPTAEEVEKDGVDLGEMVKLQQVKIEELTLLLIQLQKQMDLNLQKN